MIYLIDFLLLGSVLLVVLGLFSKKQVKSAPVLELTEQAEKETRRPAFFKLFKPIMPVNKLIVDKLLGGEKFRQKVMGSGIKLLPEEFVLLWGIFFIIAYLAACRLISSVLGRVDISVSMILVFLGFAVPQIWLGLQTKQRNKAILRALPDAIDLIALCVNAGLDFGLAVNWVIEKSEPNPLIEEFSLFLFEIKMGKSRRQALKDMAKRLNLPEVNSLSRALGQAERLGTPIESALNILSDEIREYRFRRGERQALLAPLKMLIPLIFFIMPVVGIIVGGPILLQFMQSGFTKFK
ncbi:MAG: type II secretion system F family protein [Deltaproteobacteria bacterium]